MDLLKKNKNKGFISNSSLILFSFGTAFFPRVFTYFGFPSLLNFVHFFVIPITFVIIIFTTKVKYKKQLNIFNELAIGSYLLLICTVLSGLVNKAGLANILLQYIMLIEPYIILLAIIAIPLTRDRLSRFKKWLFGFATFNLVLALMQSILLPLGIYPRRGGTIQDNIAGVFASGSGSAGNYVSCTVSVYFALYIFHFSKTTPIWLKILILLASLYQTYVSDSKQVFLAFFLGVGLLISSKIKNPRKVFWYLIPAIALVLLFAWALQNPNLEFLNAYRNWAGKSNIYGFDGTAFITKTAAFRIIPSHYESPLNWLFGLGPGHTVTRLGGWMIKKYASLLAPIGVTIHPASSEVFDVVWNNWIAQESTIFFPLFTWAGIWGDLGIVGLLTYLYLGYMVWKRLCLDDVTRFMLLSTVALGFMLTQMEEPGQMLTIACFLGLRYHEQQTIQL